jgi:hypothetical protein
MFPTTLSRRYASAASVQSSYLTLSGCQLLSQGGPCERQARRRRRQQALRRQRCTARRIGGCDKHCDTSTMHSPTAFHMAIVRALRSHDCQRAPRKLSVPPTILPRRYAPAASVQSPYLTLSGCQLLSQGGPCVRLARHQRRRKALRRQRFTARRIGGCDKHFEYNDALPDCFSHGRRGRDVRYARTIANAHHVSQAFMQSPCSPCAHHVLHYTAQALRAESAAYATLARSSTRIT